MGPVSRWAVNRPWQAVIAWLVLFIALAAGAVTQAGQFNDSFSLPNTDSTTAQNLLDTRFGSEVNNAMVQIPFSLQGQTIANPELETKINNLQKEIESLGSVASVQNPYQSPNPKAAIESGLVSPDSMVGRLMVNFKMADVDVPKSDGRAIISDVANVSAQNVDIGAAGTVIANSQSAVDSSGLVGVIAAIVIMLIMFGSIVAAGLPLVTALFGLAAGLSTLVIMANFVQTASFAPTLAAMIGLGVGFDYSLFLLNRYRQAVREGHEPRPAALIAVGTAGRAIVFAAVTVIIALSGLFVLGLSFLSGLAVGAGVTVICVMITAVTLLPAMISLLGKRAFGLKLPWARKEKPLDQRGRRFAAYALFVERRRWIVGPLALLFVILLAVPALQMREGFPDASTNPPGDPQRTAYYLTAQGFGVGSNGPLLVVAELPSKSALPAAEALSNAIATAPDVAFASPVAGKAISPDGTAVVITVIPKSGPQDEQTTQLLSTLRDDTIPNAIKGTGITAYVGGATATAEDFSSVLRAKLPAFLLVVVGLGFIVLMVLFRSLLIPLTAAITALLSYGAALGVSVFIFQMGHLGFLFGVSTPGPILPFLPVMLFAILFGLSMDYQVFLVSRMQEEYGKHKDNLLAVRAGLAGSGRVVVAAAAIMFSVFMSFVFQSNTTIKLFGLSLAVAIAVDAFIIRLIFVPALMTVLGNANWYIPRWLGKILPKLSVEGEEPAKPEEKSALPL